MNSDVIRVRGARVHNLQDLDVDIPRNRLVVMTGLSGSGKSSLAFDTLHAEGQRRYIESLSSYARQFLDQLEPPDVDAVEGLPPTVAIDQKTAAAGPRSTVATVTETHDFLRLLYARAGTPHCPSCNEPIVRQSPEQMVDAVLGLAPGRKVILLAPMVRGRKGQHLDTFREIQRARLLRARVDGEFIEIGEDPPKLAKTRNHTIEAVVDRLVVRDGIRPRLAEGVDLALQLGHGVLVLSIAQDDGTWLDRPLSTRYSCPRCGTGVQEIEPRSFSFNTPQGACPICEGLGTLADFDPDLLLVDPSRPFGDDAIPALRALPRSGRESLTSSPGLTRLLQKSDLTPDRPMAQWPPKRLDELFQGGPANRSLRFEGLLNAFRTAYAESTPARREALEPYRGRTVCPSCNGARIRPEARAVTLHGHPIHHLLALTLEPLAVFLSSIRFAPHLEQVGPPLVSEILRRIGFLKEVGLDYLTLDRPADSLSGGELQRVRLAAQIGSGLVGVGYVLDEPTAGLHPRDTARLLRSLSTLRDQGNSILVVEHDEATIRAADWLIDLGPGAGPDGGQLVAEGPPDALVHRIPGASATWNYLQKSRAPEFSQSGARTRSRKNIGKTLTSLFPDPPRLAGSPGFIQIQGARENNLKSIDVQIPLGTLTSVSGVSGSGKSSLILDILGRAAIRHHGGGGPRPGLHDTILGLDQLDRIILVDQSPIGRTPRSTPATYTGLFDDIRRLFANAREARVRGYSPSRFSFNTKGGRCETCLGQGARKLEMDFLSDLYLTCPDCRGLRFNPATLEVRFRGCSIGEVLQLRVDEALAVFEAIPRVLRGLQALHQAGLGYVTLGQPSTTLSGGEAQRVKLAAELGRGGASDLKTLYILDEPTTGLHFADVDNLLNILHRLADLGHTVVVIEHNLEVLRASDWIIDLGPEAGAAGGYLVAQGPPQTIARTPASHTGRFLA